MIKLTISSLAISCCQIGAESLGDGYIKILDEVIALKKSCRNGFGLDETARFICKIKSGTIKFFSSLGGSFNASRNFL